MDVSITPDRHDLDVGVEVERLGDLHHVKVTVANTGHEDRPDWSLLASIPSVVAGSYGVRIAPVADTRLRLAPEPWQGSLPPKGSVTFGLLLRRALAPQATTACPSLRGSEPAAYPSPQRAMA